MLSECCEIMEANISFNSTSEQVNYNSTATHCFESSICLGFHIVCCVIGTIGILSNGITLVVVGKEKRLHTVTYVSISCLALADFVYVSSRVPRDNLQFWYRQRDEFNLNFVRVCDLLSLSGACSSILHVILLSLLRYVLLVHPLKSHVWLTVTKVKLISFMTWVLSIAIASFYLYAVVINGRINVQLAKVTNLTVTVVMSVLPIVLIVTLHTLKARTLLRSLASCQKSTVRRMSRMVTFIITAFILTTLPSSVADCIKIALIESGSSEAQRSWLSVLQFVGRLGLYINFSTNPFIYLTTSSQFRKAMTCQRNVYRSSFSNGSNCRTESF